MNYLPTFIAVTLILSLTYTSMAEWMLHKYLMHRPLGRFTYPFETHTLTHHRMFRADQSYHWDGKADPSKITMAWWNGAAIILIGGLPYWIGAIFLMLLSWWIHAWTVVAIGIAVSATYYGVYEYAHWCMHLPKARRLERSWIFRRLNGHHILHHRYMAKNFNVVLPIADLLFGTFLPRAKVAFAQVRGRDVPDVQPFA